MPSDPKRNSSSGSIPAYCRNPAPGATSSALSARVWIRTFRQISGPLIQGRSTLFRPGFLVLEFLQSAQDEYRQVRVQVCVFEHLDAGLAIQGDAPLDPNVLLLAK